MGVNECAMIDNLIANIIKQLIHVQNDLYYFYVHFILKGL